MKIPIAAFPPSHALRLRVLGSLELTRPDGAPVGSVLAQPKRLALLAFLVLSGDGGFLRRDMLLNVFWPEFDQERARAALRKALYFLRQSLGDEVIIARGDDELRVNAERLWCDALAFEGALKADRVDDALGLYRGDLLSGFFVSGQPDFENWVDGERTRLRLLAARAAATLSDRAEIDGDLERAVRLAQTAIALDATSEPAFRRVAALLYRRGDHGGLARAYDEWRCLLDELYGIQPAAETQEMVAALLVASTNTEAARGPPNSSAPAELDHSEVALAEPAGPPAAHRPRRALAWAGAAMTAGVLFAAAVFVRAEPTLKRERVLVSAFENDTGDPALDPVGRIAADWIAHGLMQSGGIEVVSRTSALFALQENEQQDIRAMAERTRAGTVVSGRYFLANGMLRMQAEVTDAKEGRLLHAVAPIAVSLDSITSGAEQLRQRVSSALAARFDWSAEWNELTHRSQPPTYAAYAEFVAGWDLFARVLFHGFQVTGQAAEHFERAWALDTTFHLARLYAVLMYNHMNRYDRSDSLLSSVALQRDRLPPIDKLLLEYFEAIKARDNERALRAARAVNKVAPNSLLAEHAGWAVATNRPREALAAHGELDPEHGLFRAEQLYWRWLSAAQHMLADYRRELKDTRAGREREPELMGPIFVEARALAGLGRPDEVERVLEQTLTMPKQHFTPGAVMLHSAAELRAHGHREAAARVLARAFAWHETQPTEERRALRETLARTLYEAGRWQEARALFHELSAEQPANLLRLGYLGLSAARSGDRAEAHRISAAIASLPSQRVPLHHVWRARIAAALGDREHAITLLRQAFVEGMIYGPWLHLDRDLDSLRRDARFRELVRLKG